MDNGSRYNIEDRDYSREVISKISSEWPTVSQVMQHEEIEQQLFNPEISDFIEDMIPFRQLPQWDSLGDKDRNDLLSAGWIIYQSNTIFIETDLVTPACIEIIKLRQTDLVSSEIARSMSEALTDEGYHTLLAVLTCDLVRKERCLNVFPTDFHLTTVMNKHFASLNDQWQRRIAYIATACCTENHITDYLALLDAAAIQPILLQSVRAHARDEWSHGSQFSVLAKEIYWSLEEKGKKIFKDTVELVGENFFRSDFGAWSEAISALNRPSLSKLQSEINSTRKELEETVEFTSSNRGLIKLYDNLEWKWDKS
ncbi:diiron oxygenase [Pseudomonas oryzihabitans]|uniref:diiron oxygenase n=1 Tax=Pseudomonas oryzihabitans TaxID=47885 RepID=UPI0028671C32|nr:diiron oxygenase [Pseudomonas psychrotolerans]MDR6680224.1 hypothetical protein [Pseudomonas psychrotolerans]